MRRPTLIEICRAEGGRGTERCVLQFRAVNAQTLGGTKVERHSTSTTGGIKQHFGRRPAKIVAIAAVVVAGTVPAALLASQGAGASGTARPAATPANPPALHNATP